MESGRRFVRSILPSRTSSRQDSRPTTLLGAAGPGTPGRPEYIDPETEYGQYPHSTMQQTIPEPSGPPPRRVKPELVPANDKLVVFRTLTGIDSGPGLTTGFYDERIDRNIGIYGRVVTAEKSARTKYKIFSVLINVCLGLQLVVAAALTALGAGNGPHKLVTALGGINTVIAGLMTYLKGSGLPHRLKYYESEWTKVREFIEQREREFCREGCALNVEDEVRLISNMYDDVKGDIEINTSDGILSASSMQRKLDAQAGDGRPSLARGLSTYAPQPTHGTQNYPPPTSPYHPTTSQYHPPPPSHHPTAPPERSISPGNLKEKEKEKEVTHMV